MVRRFWIIVCSLLLIAAWGCESEGPGLNEGKKPSMSNSNNKDKDNDNDKETPKSEEPRLIGLEELEEMLDSQPGAVRIPLDFLTIFMPLDDEEVVELPSLEEISEKLNTPEFEMVAQGLQAAGWSDEEAASIVFGGLAHNSGQPYDPVRYRSDLARKEMTEAIEEFEAELARVEEEQNIRFDREALQKLGIPTRAWLTGGNE